MPKTLNLEEILETKTVLLPEILAERAVSYYGHHPEKHKIFIVSCVERFVAHYNNNIQFKKLVESNARDAIISFMYHWFSAYIKNPERYMENINFLVKIIECGICGGFHRVDYVGDCRRDSERFTDIEDATEKLQKYVVEVFEEEIISYYRCPNCKKEWSSVWTSATDEDCPDDDCGTRDINPYRWQYLNDKDGK